MTAPPLGLYSIGVRGLDAGELISLAGAVGVPFLHLRGGPKGYDLARVPVPQIEAWARQARQAAPVTMVTGDIDASTFLSTQDDRGRQVSAELDALAAAAARFGARAVRLLGRTVPQPPAREDGGRLPDLRAHGLLTLVELHDPEWFAPDGLAWLQVLLDQSPGTELLLDSHQVHTAWEAYPHPGWPGLLEGLAHRVGAVHLSDPGTGLDGEGHRLLARAVRMAKGNGRDVDVAFEWTGPDRTPAACLARYRDAITWWGRSWEGGP
jgi:hypothetical protein